MSPAVLSCKSGVAHRHTLPLKFFSAGHTLGRRLMFGVSVWCCMQSALVPFHSGLRTWMIFRQVWWRVGWKNPFSCQRSVFDCLDASCESTQANGILYPTFWRIRGYQRLRRRSLHLRWSLLRSPGQQQSKHCRGGASHLDAKRALFVGESRGKNATANDGLEAIESRDDMGLLDSTSAQNVSISLLFSCSKCGRPDSAVWDFRIKAPSWCKGCTLSTPTSSARSSPARPSKNNSPYRQDSPYRPKTMVSTRV